MLSIMTYNWWIFIAVIGGSFIGYLLFGWGKMNTLELMASSTLPPQVVPKSTLQDETNESTRCLHQDDNTPKPQNEPSLLEVQGDVESENLLESGGPDSPPPDYSEVTAPGLRKVDVRIDLQGDVISKSEFSQRLVKSKETEV